MINPRDFIPVPSAEFRQICQIVIDGDTIERRIKDYFLLAMHGFRNCDVTHLQMLYSQVEQKFCTEAMLATIDSLQSRSHGFRHHKQKLWTNLKEMLDA